MLDSLLKHIVFHGSQQHHALFFRLDEAIHGVKTRFLRTYTNDYISRNSVTTNFLILLIFFYCPFP